MRYSEGMSERVYDNWMTQLRRGLLELCILNALRGSRLYGYDIVKRLRAIEGLMISEGTIYPILSRFRREGLVETSIEESPHGPARKYYHLTDRGEAFLSQINSYWQIIKSGVDAIQGEPKS